MVAVSHIELWVMWLSYLHVCPIIPCLTWL